MNWLNKLEKKYGKYGIPNLIQYIVGGMALVFVFDLLNPGITSALVFVPSFVLQGEIWRLFTFLFLPRTTSIIWILFSLLFTWFIGRTLEQYWGTFRFNVYYIVGVLGTLVGGIVVQLVLPNSLIVLSNEYLNMTMFLAVASIMPEYEIRVYMILPVKLKYLGYIYAAMLGFQLLFGDIGTKVVILMALLNYLLFFGPGLLKKGKQAARKQQYVQANKPKAKVRPRKGPKNGDLIQVAFHCCEACGKTEVDDPNIEFRYCSKCVGHHEYCTEHILDHEHKTEA